MAVTSNSNDSQAQRPETTRLATSANADRAVLIGTSGPAAIRAGVEAMRAGGTAMDAALVAALAQTTLAAGCWVSFAGIMGLIYYHAATGVVHAMNAAYNTVIDETDPLSIPRSGSASARTVLVPGFMAGVEAAHQRFGRLAFPRIFEPAIEMAEEGFPIDAVMDKWIRARKTVLTRFEEGRELFLEDGKQLKQQGALLKQPRLAKTLRGVAHDGADFMYSGPWGRKLVDRVSKQGGKITLKDLASYQVLWPHPLQCTYRDHQMFAPGLPGYGGLHLVEALNLLECAGLLGDDDYAKRPDTLYWLIQVTHAAYMGPFCSSELRRSKESAAVLWEKMRKLGGLRLLDALYLHQHINHGHSDALVAVDQEGNVAALCHSINTATWGATGIFVDGVSIPDSGCFQQWQIRQAGRGARLPDAMNPVIVLKSGRPVLAASCTGIGLHETALQHLIDVLIFGMHPEAAVDRPHFMGPVWPKLLQSAGGTGRLARLGESCFWLFASMALRLFPEARSRLNVGQAIEDEGFADDVLEGLRKMGQPVRLVPRNLPLGYWAGVRIDADSGALAGAVTPRPRDSGASAVGCD